MTNNPQGFLLSFNYIRQILVKSCRLIFAQSLGHAIFFQLQAHFMNILLFKYCMCDIVRDIRPKVAEIVFEIFT